jgi:hypothetical protein
VTLIVSDETADASMARTPIYATFVARVCRRRAPTMRLVPDTLDIDARTSWGVYVKIDNNDEHCLPSVFGFDYRHARTHRECMRDT